MGWFEKQTEAIVTECARRAAASCVDKTTAYIDKTVAPQVDDVSRTIKRAVWASVGLTVGYIIYDRFWR
jgi:hypothetical protein